MAEKEKKSDLGRLVSLGVDQKWKAPFYLPRKYIDLRNPICDFSKPLADDAEILVRARIKRFDVDTRAKPPRMKGFMTDGQGNDFLFFMFGDTRELQEQIKRSQPLNFLGKVKYFNDTCSFNIASVVADSRIGSVASVYQGKEKVIGPAKVAQRMSEILPETYEVAAKWVKQQISGSPKDSSFSEQWIEKTLRQAHCPSTPEKGHAAIKSLDRLAAYICAWQVKSHQWRPTVDPWPVNLKREDVKHFGFDLTDDQRSAIKEIVADVKQPLAMRRLLSGDVGTGKTAVYGLVANAMAREGANVYVMLPNESLAHQIAKDLHEWFPEQHVRLITGSGDFGSNESKIVVGTTALLHKDDLPSPDLLVVDEQQKFSREQREKLTSEGAHLLEVTATCLPRSQALLQYGVMQTTRLKQCPVKKDIATKLWRSEERGNLFEQIRGNLDSGEQLLVVYPRKTAECKDELPSVEEAAKLWEKVFPGKVGHVHSDQPSEQKNATIDKVKKGELQILLATTVVEVGLNIPGLRRVMVVHPEYLGLSTLHQIRGRVARHGGNGWFDLYCPKPISPNGEERMKVLEQTSDGFKVAWHDAKLRGVGNLRHDSDVQSGQDTSMILNRKLDMDALEAIMAKWFGGEPEHREPKHPQGREEGRERVGQKPEDADQGMHSLRP